MCFFLKSTSLFPGSISHTRLSFIFSAPVLESDISPRNADSFDWRMVLEAKIWVLGALIARGVSLLQGHFFFTSEHYICDFFLTFDFASITLISVIWEIIKVSHEDSDLKSWERMV